MKYETVRIHFLVTFSLPSPSLLLKHLNALSVQVSSTLGSKNRIEEIEIFRFFISVFDFRPQPATNWYRTVNQLIKLHSSEACKLTKPFVFFFGSKIRVFVCSHCSNWGPKDGNGNEGVVGGTGGGGSGCERGHVTSSLGTCCLLRLKFLLISSKHGSSRKVSRWFVVSF